MQTFPNTLILRHRKENLKKCTLHSLENRRDFVFYTYPQAVMPDLTDYVLLTLEAPPLTIDDQGNGLLVIDGTWRYAERMMRWLGPLPNVKRRCLPKHYRTAYPRKQTDCCDPERGLASIEAVYIAYWLLNRSVEGLLENYYWEKAFITQNEEAFSLDKPRT